MNRNSFLRWLSAASCCAVLCSGCSSRPSDPAPTVEVRQTPEGPKLMAGQVIRAVHELGSSSAAPAEQLVAALPADAYATTGSQIALLRGAKFYGSAPAAGQPRTVCWARVVLSNQMALDLPSCPFRSELPLEWTPGSVVAVQVMKDVVLAPPTS